MPIWSRRSLLPARTNARLRLSGDQTTWSERSRPAWSASSMMTLVLAARSSSQVRPFLSVCASHLPSGDGYRAERWLAPSVVRRSPWPEPSAA